MKGRPTSEQFQKQLEDMVNTLRSEIVRGRYAAGECLPSEKLLAARFGLGNVSVRKGLEQLVEEELIEKIPRVGNRVRIKRTKREPVSLTISCNDVTVRNLELPRLLDEFHKQYPWIQVDYKITSAQSMDGDVITMDNFQFQSWIETGAPPALEPLEPPPDLYPGLFGQFMLRDRLYLQPIVFSPVVLCYNKTHFRECGLYIPDGSWTWDDLAESAEKLSEVKGRYGFCFHVPDLNRWPLFLLLGGGRFDWDGARLKPIRGTPLLEGLRLCRNLIQNRKAFPLYLSQDNYDISQMFAEGKISMILTTYLGLNRWKRTELDYDIAPVPFIGSPRTLSICLGVGVSTETRYPEEARLLAGFFTSPIAQRFIQKHTMSIPSSRSLPVRVTDDAIRRPERYPMFRDMMFSLRTHRDLNVPAAALRILFNPIKAYWADLIDEEELCARLESISFDTNTSTTDGI
ncbi:extracellular solute-binding protein [Paenibacillus hodogayensis]|uniref:Extracellular solute-binding protein n=1 Tax=Paenibacillus hodogayensis TaxID=279208 RepID=A0ABV5W1J4_9BACL